MLSASDADVILKRLAEYLEAKNRADTNEQNYSSKVSPKPFYIEEIDLTDGYPEGRPRRILSTWRSLWVTKATTDSGVTANLTVNGRGISHIRESLPLTRNFKYGSPYEVAETFLTAPPQPGKKIVILFVKEGNIDPGTLEQALSGGVAVTTGDTISTPINLNSVSAPVQIVPTDANRKGLLIQNQGISNAYVGNASVTAAGPTRGFLLLPDESIMWITSAETWVCSDATTDIHATPLR